MSFIPESRELLRSLPTLTGDAARLAIRLTTALDLLERSTFFVSVKLGDDTPEIMTWAEFEQANEDGMDRVKLSSIRFTVLQVGTYWGGGGAAPAYTVKYVTRAEATKSTV